MAFFCRGGKVTPPRINRIGGYGSPLRWAPEKGPPCGGRHQPFLSRLPTVFVIYTRYFGVAVKGLELPRLIALEYFVGHVIVALPRFKSRLGLDECIQ